MNNTNLVLLLFKPNKYGISRWVSKNEFVDDFASLYPRNGNHWMRNRGLSHLKLEKNVINNITHWRFNGFVENQKSNRPIKKEIRNKLSNKPCAHTGFNNTTNNQIVIDHKNGRYDDENVLNIETQKEEDFQPLCAQANLNKRTDCNKCINTGIRFDAKTLGFPISFIEGSEKYEGTCNGCYWNDCIKFKQALMLNT